MCGTFHSNVYLISYIPVNIGLSFYPLPISVSFVHNTFSLYALKLLRLNGIFTSLLEFQFGQNYGFELMLFVFNNNSNTFEIKTGIVINCILIVCWYSESVLSIIWLWREFCFGLFLRHQTTLTPYFSPLFFSLFASFYISS